MYVIIMNDTQNVETNSVDNEMVGASPETEWDVIRRKQKLVGRRLLTALEAYTQYTFGKRVRIEADFNVVLLHIGRKAERKEYEVAIWENDQKSEDNAACFCETVEFDETVLEHLPAGQAIEQMLAEPTGTRRAFSGTALKGLVVRAIREYDPSDLDVRSEAAVDRAAYDRSLVIRMGDEEFKLVFSRRR